MTRCTTTSGPFRCEKDLGHQGECEASPYATARLPCVIAAVPVAPALAPKDEEPSK